VPGAGGGGDETTCESGSDEQPARRAMAPITPNANERVAERGAKRAGIFVFKFMLRTGTDACKTGSCSGCLSRCGDGGKNPTVADMKR
jgi:hypothetical protein